MSVFTYCGRALPVGARKLHYLGMWLFLSSLANDSRPVPQLQLQKLAFSATSYQTSNPSIHHLSQESLSCTSWMDGLQTRIHSPRTAFYSTPPGGSILSQTHGKSFDFVLMLLTSYLCKLRFLHTYPPYRIQKEVFALIGEGVRLQIIIISRPTDRSLLMQVFMGDACH